MTNSLVHSVHSYSHSHIVIQRYRAIRYAVPYIKILAHVDMLYGCELPVSLSIDSSSYSQKCA